MDLTPAEVVGHTCYHFVHVEDLENIRQSHEDCESHAYQYVDSFLPVLGCDAWKLAQHAIGMHSLVLLGALCCHNLELSN